MMTVVMTIDAAPAGAQLTPQKLTLQWWLGQRSQEKASLVMDWLFEVVWCCCLALAVFIFCRNFCRNFYRRLSQALLFKEHTLQYSSEVFGQLN